MGPPFHLTFMVLNLISGVVHRSHLLLVLTQECLVFFWSQPWGDRLILSPEHLILDQFIVANKSFQMGGENSYNILFTSRIFEGVSSLSFGCHHHFLFALAKYYYNSSTFFFTSSPWEDFFFSFSLDFLTIFCELLVYFLF